MDEKEEKVQRVIIEKESNNAAVTSLVLGLIGVIVGFFPYIGWFMAPVWLLAIIFGLVGLRKKYRRGMSITGLVLGIVGVVYKVGFWLFLAGGLFSLASGAADEVTGSSSQPEVESTSGDTEAESEAETEPAIVPEIEANDLESATSFLEEDGFKVGSVVEEESEEVEEGTVIRTEPEGGTEVALGTEVTVYLASKPANELILQDWNTGENLDIIQGRKEQKFVFVDLGSLDEETAEDEEEDFVLKLYNELSNNKKRFEDAELEVVLIIDESTSHKAKEIYKQKLTDFPVYLDIDENYDSTHIIAVVPDIQVEDGVGNTITEVSGDSIYFNDIEPVDIVNEILDKVKIHQ